MGRAKPQSRQFKSENDARSPSDAELVDGKKESNKHQTRNTGSAKRASKDIKKLWSLFEPVCRLAKTDPFKCESAHFGLEESEKAKCTCINSTLIDLVHETTGPSDCSVIPHDPPTPISNKHMITFDSKNEQIRIRRDD